MALALRPAAAVTESSVPLRTFVTLVLWLGCLAIGILGFILPHPRQASDNTPAPILELEIPVEQLPAPTPGRSASGLPSATFSTAAPPAPPALPPFQELPPAPQRLEVRSPQLFTGETVTPAPPATTTPAFHVPAPSGTAPDVPTPSAPADAPPTLEILAQPAPDYPRAARQAGQEGEVRVALTVGTDGRITQARIQVSSRWPLLDQEALRTVREKWRFAPGTVRRYEAPIRFQLRK